MRTNRMYRCGDRERKCTGVQRICMWICKIRNGCGTNIHNTRWIWQTLYSKWIHSMLCYSVTKSVKTKICFQNNIMLLKFIIFKLLFFISNHSSKRTEKLLKLWKRTYFVVTTFHQILLYGDRMLNVDILVQFLDWQQFQFLETLMVQIKLEHSLFHKIF